MSEILGKIKEVGETMTVGSAGTFRKRTLVVSTNEQYVQHIPIDFVQDKCDLLDNYRIGDEVKVSINIRGNEYNSKYYVSLNGWRIDKNDSYKNGNQPQSAEKAYNNKPQANTPNSFVDEEPDDLPFQ